MNNTNKDFIRHPLPRTISEFIYSSLKEEIMSNELKANQRINDNEIAARYHVSRTPIREAVLRLATEGFVRIDSYRRAIIKELSFEELKEIMEVLGALDRLAISLAIDNITQKEIHWLEKITNKMEKYCSQKTAEKYMRLNEEYHQVLWKSVRNKFLMEIIKLVREKRERYSYARLSIYKNPLYLEKSMKHHHELMEAIKTRNKERLMELAVEHRNILLESGVYNEHIKDFIEAKVQSQDAQTIPAKRPDFMKRGII